MTPLASLKAALGNAVITSPNAMRPYLQGMMAASACNETLCVLQPRSFVQLWQAITLAAQLKLVIIPQAANTSLTGGSTPFGQYGRGVCVLSLQKLDGIHLLNNGTEAIALPASTLQTLENILAPLGREPHSVLGSTCVGASVIGGICNNSGGALVQRGPAYTEHALYARLNTSGQFELINHLGIDLGATPDAILQTLDSGRLPSSAPPLPPTQAADYRSKVRDIAANTPARHNGDADRLFEASGSSGRLIVLAVRLPTYPKAQQEQVFLYSCGSTAALSALRREYLASDRPLPILAEYLDENYARTTLRYGRDTCFAMNRLQGSTVGSLYRLRSRIENFIPSTWIDRAMQIASPLFPRPLNTRCQTQVLAHKHHLILKTADAVTPVMHEFLKQFTAQYGGRLLKCTAQEGVQLQTLRFAGTAAMLRYYNLHRQKYGALISTDIALPRNRSDFCEQLPAAAASQVKTFFSMGHFFCHVFHQDYFLSPNTDTNAFKKALLAYYQNEHIAYPAEHNVGHLYDASSAQRKFFQNLDPTNSLNPGIGRTPKGPYWQQP